MVFTIGHSKHPLDQFHELLRESGVDVVVDVRSYPGSRHAPQFSRASLTRFLQARGVAYAFAGSTLGGRPQGPEFYDEEGHVRYDLLAQSIPFNSGINQLVDLTKEHRVAVLCAEEDPTDCHRRLLIGRVLAGKGFRIVHIRGDGKVATDEALETEPIHGRQESMFAENEEPLWRSTRSVSPRGQQRASSKP